MSLLEIVGYVALFMVGLIGTYMLCYTVSRAFYRGYFDEQISYLERLANQGDANDGKG